MRTSALSILTAAVLFDVLGPVSSPGDYIVPAATLSLLVGLFLVAGQNFASDSNVLVMVMLISIFGVSLLMVAGGEMGKRVQVKAKAK